jgi:hypothetical protein
LTGLIEFDFDCKFLVNMADSGKIKLVIR